VRCVCKIGSIRIVGASQSCRAVVSLTCTCRARPTTRSRPSTNREFYAQLDKQGLVIDARFNEGGRAADYAVEALRRAPLYRAQLRAGGDIQMPVGVIDGPKVLLTNELSGSGGDTLPWMAQRTRAATVVGMRTAGAGIGATSHELLDGGMIRVPDWGWYDPQTGTWLVENRGMTPDIVVENLPADWRAGRDAQLERAVQIALDAIRKRNVVPPKRPPFPVYK
jgi:tricorn protease